MNMRSLAKLAGVSPSTVSKAFSGSREISEATRQRIFDIAKENGVFDIYSKNTYEKRIIGVICPELNNDYYIKIVTLLDREIQANNGIMLLSISHFEHGINEKFSYFTSHCKADGIIAITPNTNLKNPSLVPAVAIHDRYSHIGVDSMRVDLYSSIEKAILYLKELGHTDIGFVDEKAVSTKRSCYEAAMRKAGLAIRDDIIKISKRRFEESGAHAVNMYLKDGRLPTAIIAGYDSIAIGIINELKKHDIRVPKDVSVIGMDDTDIASFFDPKLSSIHMYMAEACRRAIEVIMKKIDNQYYRPHEDIVIPTEFIVRESIGPAPSIAVKAD